MNKLASRRSGHDYFYLEQLSLAIVLLDDIGRITWLNPVAEELLGSSHKSLKGRQFAQSLVASGQLPVLIEQSLADGIFRHVLEEKLLLASGRSVSCDCRINSLGDAGLMLEIHDWADRQPATELGRQQRQDASLTLVQNILSHEIRNPLGGMRGAAQMLHSALPEAELRSYTRLIIREIDRLNELVGQAVEPWAVAAHAQLNIHQIINEVVALVDADTAARVQILKEYDPSIPEIPGHSNSLRQLLLNLMQNAVQADARKICIRTRIAYGEAVQGRRFRSALIVEFADDGAGVDEALRENLFLPLVSGKSTGKGLGLAVSQQVAMAHGGVLKLVEDSQDTVFQLVLPLAKQHD